MGKQQLDKWTNQISISKKLYLVIGIMGAFIAIELLALGFSLGTLSALRAYVCGESLWSKSQKNAMYALQEYADTGDPKDYIAFREFLNEPMGDRQGRIELEKENPDIEYVRQSFIQGGNHPKDVDGMILLFQRFRHLSYMEQAISIWEEADPYMLKLITISVQINKEYESGNPSREKINALLAEAKKINIIVTKLEEDFSYILGEASRWLENLLLYTLILTAFTAEALCLILIFSAINGITSGVNEVIRVSKLVSKGDFTDRAYVHTKDEIGLLAESFNAMIKDTGQNIEGLRLAEKRIREREQQIQTIFTSAPDGVIVTDIDGIITIWNPKAEEIFGWSADEAIGKTIAKIIEFPQLLRDDTKGMRYFFRTEESLSHNLTLETQSLKKDGTELEIILSMSPTMVMDKYVIVCFIKDITDNKKASNALEIETRYVKLLQSIAVASNEASSINEAGQIALEKICELIKWPVGHMLIKDNSENFVSSGVWYLGNEDRFKPFKEISSNTTFTVGERLLSQVLLSRKAEWIIDITEDTDFNRSETAKEIGLSSAFAFPIMIRDEVVALLEFYSSLKLYPNSQLLEVVGNIGKQLGRVVERQRASDEIKASEEKLRALTETAIDSIISADSRGNIIYFNTGAEKAFGYTSEEIMNKPLTLIMPENMRNLHTEGLLRYQRTREAHVIGKAVELIGKKKNGDEFPVELTISIWTAKGETFYTGVIRDITERKEKDAELLKLSAVASYTNNAIIITDKTGKIEWVNDGFTRLSGFTLPEIVEKNASNKAQFIDNKTIKKLIQDKTPVSYEIKSTSKKGDEYWVLATLTPILDHSGDVQKIIIIDSDITKQKATEEALIRAKQIAEASEKTKELFLANMSHEIRTPMNAIIGFTRLLKDTKLTIEQKEWLKTIENSGENLLVIINDILDFSKIEAGKLEFEESEIDIAGLVQSTITMLKPKGKEKGIDLYFSVDDQIPAAVLGDSVRLTQTLLNLLSNGVKFTNRGKVECIVSVLKETEHDVLVQFEISDTGIGIPEDKLGMIFESFAQVSSNTTRKYGGTGLGLTITKKIIEQQGGTITVSSQVNEGSSFVFVLTFKKTEKLISGKPEKHHSDLDPEVVTDLRLLLVEDNVVNQKLAKTVLEKWEINTDIADNGQIALQLLQNQTYDIILMDLQMPEMDGYETTEHIRRNELTKHIPIIAMSAHALKGEAERCIRIGMNDYISKPFSPTELLAKIIRHSQSELPDFKTTVTKHEYNLDYIRELSGDNDEFMNDIIALFIKDTPPQLNILLDSVNAHEWERLKLAAHKLKTSIGIFGLHECAEGLSVIEEYAKKLIHLDQLPELVVNVVEECNQALENIKAELDKRPL